MKNFFTKLKETFKAQKKKPSDAEWLLLAIIFCLIIFKYSGSRSVRGYFSNEIEAPANQYDHFDALRHYDQHGGGRSIFQSKESGE